MPRNTLGDLNNHLFEQMERLNDDDLTDEGLKTEIERARAMSKIGSQIINTGKLVLEAEQFKEERVGENETPRMLEG